MSNKQGFTFVELIVVISIISILSVLGSFAYVNYAERARDSRRRIDIQQLRSVLELYRSNTDDGVYPTATEYGSGSNSVLVTRGLIQTIPVDPRRAVYTYTPLPAGCNNTSSYCTSYRIQTTLETTGAVYVVTPGSVD